MNIKQRAHELLTCDELRGRVPEEVQAFLREVMALEPVGYFDGHDINDIWPAETYQLILAAQGAQCNLGRCYPNALYDLGAPNDPA